MTKRRSSRRAPRLRPRAPYRQGDLDGLCGLYSIVNAVRVLCPEVGNAGASALFDHVMQALPLAGINVAIAVVGGIGRGVMARLMRAAMRYVADEFDIELTITRLPKAQRRSMSLDALWRALGEELSPRCVAVLSLDGRHEHWTVAIGVTPQQISLYDSGELGALRRSSCTVGRATARVSIAPAHVFLIRRRGV